MNTDDKDFLLEENEEENEEFYDFRYNSLKKKGAVISLILIWLFCLIIFGVSGLHLLSQDLKFSESENRVLSQFPKLSISSVVDGSFMKGFETYLTDQFPLRDNLISVKTFAGRLVGKNEENGVFIGKNGYLFDSQTPLDKKQVKDISKAVLAFKEKHQDFKTAFVLVPNSTYVYSEYLPKYLELDNHRQLISYVHKQINDDSILWPAASKLLKAQAENTQLYYKTDHHWTTRAAYILFKDLALAWGLENDEKAIDDKFSFYEVSDSFEGTLASTSGVHDSKDKIEICVPEKSEGTYVVNFESSGDKTASLFFKDKLKSRNHYEVFLGGNYDKVIISTVSSSKRSLLLIKDSYANCMIPMLTPYFSKIVVIDPRYLTDSLDSIVKENDFSHMMYLYNVNTLLEDSSLASCLGS